MKRIFLATLLILSLCACGKVSEAAEPELELGSEVRAEYMQSHIIAELTEGDDGSMTFKIKEPNVIQGITVRCSDDGIAVSCGSVRLEMSDGYYPFSELYRVVTVARNTAPLSTEKSGKKTILKYEDFSIITDSETNKTEKINAKACRYELR